MNDLYPPENVVSRADVLEKENRTLRKSLNDAQANFRVVGENPGLLFEALAKAQLEFGAIERTATAEVKGETSSGKPFSYTFDYAPLDEVLDKVRPALNKNGLAIFWPLYSGTGGGHVLETWLTHSSGARLECKLVIPPPPDGRGEKIQKVGSAITYLRRYALQCIVGVCAEEDDDGNAGDGNERQLNRRPQAPPRPPQGHGQQQRQVPPQGHAKPAPTPERQEQPQERPKSEHPPAETKQPAPETKPVPEETKTPPAETPVDTGFPGGPMTPEQGLELGNLAKAIGLTNRESVFGELTKILGRQVTDPKLTYSEAAKALEALRARAAAQPTVH